MGGFKLKVYALGGTTPLHVAKVNPVIYKSAIALDLHGHLCEANGEISQAALLEYRADDLTYLRGLNGVGAYPALVADRLGYLYASTGGAGIEVYAPGCTRLVNVIHRGANAVGPLVFDRAGNLYAGIQPHFAVSVYAPTARPGHMRFVRQIREGISGPSALAIGPSGDLFVANYRYRERRSYITVYRPGGSTPVRRITKGMNVAGSLAVDSKGRLYVATIDYEVRSGGWVSVYSRGASQPTRELHMRDPVALAVDPFDNLYVANIANRSSVFVYSAGATKLLQTIDEGRDEPSALLIDAPW